MRAGIEGGWLRAPRILDFGLSKVLAEKKVLIGGHRLIC